MNALNWEGASGRRLSAVTLTGLVLALAAGALALAAALGYRTGTLDLGTSFSFLRWGARGGVAALVVSVAGLVLTVVRGRGRSLDDLVPGAAAGVLAILIGAVSYAIPAGQQSTARASPPIHDITTDMEDPPAFVAVLPLRADAPNPPDYDPEIASAQREAYPDLGPIILDDPPAARSSAHSAPWTPWAGSWSPTTPQPAASKLPTRRSGTVSRMTWSFAFARTAAAAASTSVPSRASDAATWAPTRHGSGRSGSGLPAGSAADSAARGAGRGAAW